LKGWMTGALQEGISGDGRLVISNVEAITARMMQTPQRDTPWGGMDVVGGGEEEVVVR